MCRRLIPLPGASFGMMLIEASRSRYAADTLPGPLRGDAATPAAALEVRGVAPGQVFDAVLASRHHELVLLDVLSLQVAFDQFPALHENGGFAFEEVLQVGHSVADS